MDFGAKFGSSTYPGEINWLSPLYIILENNFQQQLPSDWTCRTTRLPFKSPLLRFLYDLLPNEEFFQSVYSPDFNILQ